MARSLLLLKANGPFRFFEVLTMKVASVLALALLALGASQAQAVPITYTMSGNGGYDNPIGSFTYDAATNAYSDVSIWSLDYYSSALSSSTASSFRSIGAIGTSLRLTFSSALTDAGGDFTFTGYERGILTLFGRVVRSGEIHSVEPSIQGSSVHEPNASLLLALGLIGLWLAPRRRSVATQQ